MFPQRDDIEEVCLSYKKCLAKADSGEPHQGPPNWQQPFQANAQTFAYYQPVRYKKEDLWAIALEDQQQGDGLAMGPDIGLPLVSKIPADRDLLNRLGLATLSPHPLDEGEKHLADLDSVGNWLMSPDVQKLDYLLFMNAWQFFEKLARERGKAKDSWLHSAVYQHLWIGIYAPGLGAPIPDWRNDEALTLQAYMKTGLRIFDETAKKIS